MATVDLDHLHAIAAKFGKDFEKIMQPSHAILPTVYILDEKFVLRRGSLSGLEKFRRWAAVLQEVRSTIPFRTAEFFPSISGDLFVQDGDQYWFLTDYLSGKILSTWQQMGLASDDDTRHVLEALRKLHDETKGITIRDHEHPLSFTDDIRGKHHQTKHLLSAHANQRIDVALQRVETYEKTLKSQDLCFVHGDFHHGNVIVDDQKVIHALIDFDFCRIGHAFEDLGFTVSMCLRTFDADSFHFDDIRFQKLLQWYGLPPPDHSLFAEYVMLASIIDLHSFADGAEYGAMENREFYLRYQISLLHALAVRFGSELDQPVPEKAGPLKFPVDLSETYMNLAAELQIHPKDISERFVRGSGHGGQKINKTSSCVELHHSVSGVSVRVQEFREQHKNRMEAYKRLILKVEEKMKGKESSKEQEVFKIRKQKARRGRKAKEKMLQEKKMRGEIKKRRAGAVGENF